MSKIPPPPKDLVIPSKKIERPAAKPDPDMDQTIYRVSSTAEVQKVK